MLVPVWGIRKYSAKINRLSLKLSKAPFVYSFNSICVWVFVVYLLLESSSFIFLSQDNTGKRSEDIISNVVNVCPCVNVDYLFEWYYVSLVVLTYIPKVNSSVFADLWLKKEEMVNLPDSLLIAI